MKYILEVLGMFGDGKARCKEESFPAISFLHPDLKPRFIDKRFNKYLEYGFLRRVPGKIKGHPYFELTTRGSLALDVHRNARLKSLDRDPDRLKNHSF